MGYSDFVVATPEPQLTILLNFWLPGMGTKMSAYYKKGGLDFKVWGIGFIQNSLWMFFWFSAYWWSWTILFFWINALVAQLIWLWAQIHSYLIWKASKETYYK